MTHKAHQPIYYVLYRWVVSSLCSGLTTGTNIPWSFSFDASCTGVTNNFLPLASSVVVLTLGSLWPIRIECSREHNECTASSLVDWSDSYKSSPTASYTSPGSSKSSGLSKTPVCIHHYYIIFFVIIVIIVAYHICTGIFHLLIRGISAWGMILWCSW